MEQSDFKVLFIFPPPASPVSPYLSAPLLAGQHNNNGYNVKTLDLSVEFFNYILQKDYLKNAFEKAKACFIKKIFLDKNNWGIKEYERIYKKTF